MYCVCVVCIGFKGVFYLNIDCLINITGNCPFSQLDIHPALQQFPKFRQLAQYFMEQSVSYRTHKSYTSSVKQYLDFCVMCRCPPFPVTELNLIYYCCYRIHKVKKKTVFRDLYAIKKHAGYYGFQVDFMRVYNLNQIKLGMSKCFGNIHQINVYQFH